MEPKFKRSKVFKDTANFKLKGTTFDAQHLDQFVQFGYSGVTHGVVRPTAVTTKNSFNPKMKHRREKYHNIRPDPAFVSLPRDMQKQGRYVDQYDGPSSLILITQPSHKKSSSKTRTYYNNFHTKLPAADPLKDDLEIKSHKRQLDNMQKLKESIDKGQRMKTENNFLRKRNRLLKTNWKHGIVGIDSIETPVNEVYKQIKTQRESLEKLKARRAKARLSNLVKRDISYESDHLNDPHTKKSVDLDHHWKTKRVNPENFRSTFTSIFTPLIPPQNQKRKENIILGETKGRQFNILSNTDRIG
ncbi:unnamed protein product [Moneuplotes crassus]|uniref:Uncharacterized protein n=3 Tax=Euplotes crassus TaxID=5936 RepID=A0AAD1XJ74_EUPCR|nr:unnamed protein product [Moneuplotes crassus]